MALREQFEAQGRWLFRWRSYPPLLMIIVVVLALRDFRYPAESHAFDLAWEILCLGVALVGVGIRAATLGRVPGGTSGRSTRSLGAEVLNTVGLYSVVRHPLYLGNYLMWVGPAMFVRSWTVLVIVTLGFWLYYERIMFAEEEFLRRRFGAEYEDWASHTPAFIPRFSGWRPWILPFSISAVLRRESSGFFGLIAVFAAIEVASDVAVSGRIIADPLWTGLFLGAALLYLIVHVMARHTRLLRPHGR